MQHDHQQQPFSTTYLDRSPDAAEASTTFAFPHTRSPPTHTSAHTAFDLMDSSNDTLCNTGLRPTHETDMEPSPPQHNTAQYSFYSPDFDPEPEELHLSVDMHVQQPGSQSRMDAYPLLPPQLDVLDPSRPSVRGLWEPAGWPGLGAHARVSDGAAAQLLRLQRFSCGGMQFGSMPAMPASGTLALQPELGFASNSNRLHSNSSELLGAAQRQQQQQQQWRLMGSDHEVRAELDALLAAPHEQHGQQQRFLEPMHRQRYKFDGRGGSGGAGAGPGWSLNLSAGHGAGGSALRVTGGLDLLAGQPNHGLGMAPWAGQQCGAGGAGLPLLPLQLQRQAQPQEQQQQPWQKTLRMDEAREGSGSDSPLSLSGQHAPFGGGGRFFACPVTVKQDGACPVPVKQDGGLGAGSSPTSPRAPRLRWTRELHDDFLRCLDELGGEDKATPTTIWRLMKQGGLALHHIKSHLQKHRLSVKHDKEALAQQRQRVERRSSMVLLEAQRRGLSDAPQLPQLPLSYPHTSLQQKRSHAIGHGDDEMAGPEFPSRSFHLDAVISVSHNDAPKEMKRPPAGPLNAVQISTPRFFSDWTTNPAPPPPQLESTGMPIIFPGSWDSINSAMQVQRKIQLQLQGQVQKQQNLEHLLEQHSHHLTRLVSTQRTNSSASPM